MAQLLLFVWGGVWTSRNSDVSTLYLLSKCDDALAYV